MESPESKYKVVKKIGKGSYGTVYKVKRKSDDQIFAMKIIKLNKTDKKEIEGILNEIRILCSMNNKYICGYEEAFLSKTQKDMCIIMEYVGGGDLQDKIEECKKRRVQFNEEIIWKYLCQSLMGLKSLHKAKIIHRDIKAANIFLTKDFSTIKIGDLGVAKVAKQNFAMTQIGTPYYLAPEIWNSEKYDYRCDIFSLGVVVYELASLRVPFNGVSLQDLCSKIKRGIIKRIPRCFSDDLYEIIKLMLTTNFKRRPDATQLLQNPIVKKYIQKYNLCDLIEEKENMDQLMATIVMPKNIAQLKDKLPSKKKFRAQSCQRMGSVNSINESSPKNNIEQYLNQLQKKRKELKDKNLNSQKPKNLPPVKSNKHNKPLVNNSFAKKRSQKKSQKKVLNYQEYLQKLNQYQEQQQERKRRRMNSADARSRQRSKYSRYY